MPGISRSREHQTANFMGTGESPSTTPSAGTESCRFLQFVSSSICFVNLKVDAFVKRKAGFIRVVARTIPHKPEACSCNTVRQRPNILPRAGLSMVKHDSRDSRTNEAEQTHGLPHQSML